VSALIGLGVTLNSSPVSAASSAPGSFTSLTPQRLLDTRYGNGAPKRAVNPGETVLLQVAGRGGVPAAGGASAAVLNVTVTAPTAGGFITVWGSGSRPTASNLNFVPGQTVPNLVVVRLSPSGTVSLYNGSSGTVQLVADVSGYYRAGIAAMAGMFSPVGPSRLLDTRNGTGAPKAAVGASKTLRVSVDGVGDVPASGVSAVVLNVTVTAPQTAGYVTVWGDGPRPNASNVNFSAGQTVPNLVVAPVDSAGRVSFYNGSSGTVQLIADVSGYYLAGGPLTNGGLGSVPPHRLLDTRTGLGRPAAGAIGAGASFSLAVAGKAWVLPSGVSAVVLNVTVTAPTAGGYVTVWAGGTRPNVSNLNFSRGQTVANLVMAPVSSTGTVSFYNGSTGTVQLVADVSGYVLGADRAPQPPQASPGRYVRNLSNGGSADVTTMKNEGCADAQASTGAGPYLHLLHIGAQSQHDPLSAAHPGVALSGFSEASTPRLTYPELATALDGYLDGYVSCRTGSAAVTVAIGTNNDGDFTNYTATQKGVDWATQVIEPLRSHVGAGWLDVLGANDIEAGFASSELQAEQWETAYLANTDAKLVFDGSADACPTAFGAVGSCGSVVDDDGAVKTWTQANYIKLAYGLSPGRILVLPQVYIALQAWQWANIAFASGGQLTFAGSLTEHAAVASEFSPPQAWGALWDAISASGHLQAPQLATDLRSDWPTTSTAAVREQNARLPDG